MEKLSTPQMEFLFSSSREQLLFNRLSGYHCRKRMFLLFSCFLFSVISAEICDERFCIICSHLSDSQDELMTSMAFENAQFRCARMETCCDELIEEDIVDINTEAKIKVLSRRKFINWFSGENEAIHRRWNRRLAFWLCHLRRSRSDGEISN